MGGCQHKEAVPAASSVEPLPMQSFRRDWSADLELKGDPITRVFLREDVVVAYTKGNMAYVLNRVGGVVRFAAKVTDSSIQPLEPVILKERVIFPTDSSGWMLESVTLAANPGAWWRSRPCPGSTSR